MTLYDETIVASQIVATNRKPDVGYWVELINPVLEAAGSSIIGGNEIVLDIYVSKAGGDLAITTEFTDIEQCLVSKHYHFPVAIIEGADPITLAKRYRIQREYDTVQGELLAARWRVRRLEDRLESLLIEKGNV